jgi:hypothetical protein
MTVKTTVVPELLGKVGKELIQKIQKVIRTMKLLL